nr:hypothetical protein [Candidatus Sigynarchaeota archaeon]
MSFWSKLFSKKDLEAIDALQKEFEALLKKSDADFICLVGLTGNIKGINIINAVGKNETFGAKQMKMFAAKGVEFFSRFKALEFIPAEFEDPVKAIKFYYNEKLSFYIIPIPGNDTFVILALNAHALKIIGNMDRIYSLINQLKPEKGESS